MKRIVIILPLVCLCFAVLSVCVEAARESPPATVRFRGLDSDEAVAAILRRSCQDCHSEQTRWPWYTRLPAVGSVMRRDVSEARSHMNLSQWETYPAREQDHILKEIGAEVNNNRMPPARYRLLHHNARLSRDDVERLSQWARDERRKIRTQSSDTAGSK